MQYCVTHVLEWRWMSSARGKLASMQHALVRWQRPRTNGRQERRTVHAGLGSSWLQQWRHARRAPRCHAVWFQPDWRPTDVYEPHPDSTAFLHKHVPQRWTIYRQELRAVIAVSVRYASNNPHQILTAWTTLQLAPQITKSHTYL